MTHKLIKTDKYLLVGSDDNIKRGCFYCVRTKNIFQDEGEDVHCCNGDIRIISHLPLNGSPILEDVDLLPPYSRHQEDGVDDAVIRFKESWIKLGVTDFELSAFSEGYNKAREKYKYTEEDMIQCWNTASIDKHQVFGDQIGGYFKQYIQSLHQYPTEFETVDEYPVITDDDYFLKEEKSISKPKTITTAQGVQWVGKYK